MNGPEHQLTEPSRAGEGVTRWTLTEPGVQAWGVWAEKVPGLGEDAEPLLEHHRIRGEGVVGVFDGAGGAGNAAADPDRFGNRATSAWVASRVAALATREWFHTKVTGPAPHHSSAPEALSDRIRAALRLMRPRERSRLTGSMVRSMPTTMAAAIYRMADNHVEVQAHWAGDSRVYVLRPDEGLQVLTRDHTEEKDALRQLRRDPPMENMLSASADFRVDKVQVRLAQPFILLCATDGYFGYVDAPHQFERLLLESLAFAGDGEDLTAELERRVRAYTADDATLAMVGFGFPDFASVRDCFRARLATLRDSFGPTPDSGLAEHHRWQEQCWERYRTGYEALLPPDQEETT
ncbi:PP2C family protein-serine/threonine phosphatase [Nocardiopsis oceani]